MYFILANRPTYVRLSLSIFVNTRMEVITHFLSFTMTPPSKNENKYFVPMEYLPKKKLLIEAQYDSLI